MPIYEKDAALGKLAKYNKCKVCGERLTTFVSKDYRLFLACKDWIRTHHEGIEREASQYEQRGMESLNIETRREIMEQTIGPVKTRVLDKYIGVTSLSKPQAKEIIEKVYPDAPQTEVARAVLLCASYQLNPLMGHIFLIPFNKGKSNESWATVIGIKAKRLLASRRGSFSYVDGTPRVMTEEEQLKTFGEAEPDKLWVITKGKDPGTGAEAVGYGNWPKDKNPLGTDKGNTKFNMAAIRSESQMLDRLRPGEMPAGIDTVPEEAVSTDYTITEEAPARAELGEVKVVSEKSYEEYADQLAENVKTSKASKSKSTATPAPESEKAEEPATKTPPRDPASVKNIQSLFKACHEDWNMQPKEVLSELNKESLSSLTSPSDITETPAACYERIAFVRR